MATRFVCRNEACEENGKEQVAPNVTYVMRDGHLVPREPVECPACHSEMEMVNVKEEGPIGLNFGRFGSLSNDDKKRWILKRNKQVAKQDAEMKRFYEKKILGTNLD